MKEQTLRADIRPSIEALGATLQTPRTDSHVRNPARKFDLEPVEEHAHETASRPFQIVNLLAVVLPFVALIVAIALLWGTGVDWIHLGLMGGFYLASAVGITVGFHRLFTHKSFETSAPVRFVMGVLGSLAIEGPVLKWVATHRKHHRHSDQEDDPHSPHTHGGGLKNILLGAWHAHAGWLLREERADIERFAPDLLKDRTTRVVSKLFPLWAALSLLLPAIAGGLLTWSFKGALLGLLWGGFVRIFFVHHVTWSINSVCHIWGSRPFNSHDHSRNNAIFGVLALGEGWHNNHHAFPASARHGLKWWQFDASYLLIKGMEKVGLVWNVRVPDKARIEAKLRKAQ